MQVGISQRLVVDHVVGGASPQKRQEVQPALRAGGGEPGKISVAVQAPFMPL